MKLKKQRNYFQEYLPDVYVQVTVQYINITIVQEIIGKLSVRHLNLRQFEISHAQPYLIEARDYRREVWIHVFLY